MASPMTWYWEQRAALSPFRRMPSTLRERPGGHVGHPLPGGREHVGQTVEPVGGCSCGTTIGPYCDCGAGRVVAGKRVCLGCGVGD